MMCLTNDKKPITDFTCVIIMKYSLGMLFTTCTFSYKTCLAAIDICLAIKLFV